MSVMLNYIKLQLKLQYCKDKNNKKGNIFSMILSLLLFAVIMSLIYLLSNVLISSFNTITARQVAVLFVMVIELVLTFVAIGMQLKHIFKPFDVQITARFPISNTQLYIASLILAYLNLLIYSIFSFFPIMLLFGVSAKILTGSYVGLLVLATVLAPLIPFAISLVVSVPIMYFLSLLENHNYIRLLLFVGAIVVFFIAYDYILNILADYFIYKRLDADLMVVWQKVFIALNSIYNPFLYVKDILFLDTVLKSVGIVFLTNIIVSIIGFAISIPVYKYVHKSALEGAKNIFNRKSKVTNDSVFVAFFKREFKEILRTKVYAYFYLGVAIATPVMVFFCDRLVVNVGEAQLGTSVAMGASVLVLTAFMALINAFSGSAINKEAERFYITKIVPISFKKQLLIKGLLNLLVSIGALTISCFVIAILGFVSLEEMFVLLSSELIMACAIIFTGFNLNLKYVNLNSKSNGDVDESNVTIVMIIGIILSAILATSTIFICYFLPSRLSYIPIYLVPIICLVVSATIFGLKAEEKYYKIEAR